MTTPKRRLREEVRRARLAQPDKDALSRRICAAVMALPEYAAARTVLWYVDAGGEVRTRLTLPEALARGQRVAVPYCVVERSELELFHLEDVSELAAGAYGILEPREELRRRPGKGVLPLEVDLVVGPGVGSPRGGGRRGPGLGYYDRLLTRTRPDALLIGLAFECQVVPEVPSDPHDVVVDVVLTEAEQHRVRGDPRPQG